MPDKSIRELFIEAKCANTALHEKITPTKARPNLPTISDAEFEQLDDRAIETRSALNKALHSAHGVSLDELMEI